MAFVVLLLRALFGLIDGLIYWAGAELYDLMIQIASAKVFKQETIMTVSGRVYQLLGLIMLFKLIFSFVTYVINPDDMTDKNKGYSNLIKRIIIALCLIVITPWGFTQSRNLQEYVIKDKVIEYFVFGQTKPSNASAGYNLMYTVGKQFVKPYACVNAECTKDKDANPPKKLCDSNWDENLPPINAETGKLLGTAEIGDCAYGVGDSESLGKALIKSTRLGADGKYDLWTLMKLGVSDKDGILDWFTTDDDFAVDYQFLFSTLVGIAIDYMLIVMCIDMAVRSVKLSFYEIIAPIPIISYVGLKDGKDSMLNKWFGQVAKTYADLFTRVAGLQIAVFFIDQLKGDGFEDNGNFLVTIFLILGALTFAKELPKILEGMGIKFSGGGFNLKKKLTDDMAGSKLLRRAGAAGLGLAGGMAANAYKGASNMWKDHKANQELRQKMKDQGYRQFGKDEKNQFYKDNAHYRDLGSARNRRNFAGSVQGRDVRRADAIDAHTSRYNAIERARNDALSRATTASERARINADFNGRQEAERTRFSQESKAADSRRTARREFTQEHASEFGGGIGSAIAGGVSAAARAATSKDGKVFAGAASGVKESVDARDLRDKRQSADYGFGTRVADSVRGFAGVDTVAKARANELHDQINELQLMAAAAQDKYTRATDAASANAAMEEYKKIQTKITKTQKNLEKLYEASKK